MTGGGAIAYSPLTISPREQLGELGAQRGGKLFAVHGVGDVGGEEADPAAAVVDGAVEAHGEERLRSRQVDHGVGELDLTARAQLAPLQNLEDLGLQDVAAGDVQVG